MSTIYHIKNTLNNSFLNKKNEWNRNISSCALKEFDSEEDAKAAFVPGIDCAIVKSKKREFEETCEFTLEYRNKLLNKNGQFDIKVFNDENLEKFSSKDAAEDKACQLNVSLDEVTVRVLRKEDNFLSKFKLNFPQ